MAFKYQFSDRIIKGIEQAPRENKDKGIICVLVSVVVMTLLTFRSKEFKTMEAILHQQLMLKRMRG